MHFCQKVTTLGGFSIGFLVKNCKKANAYKGSSLTGKNLLLKSRHPFKREANIKSVFIYFQSHTQSPFFFFTYYDPCIGGISNKYSYQPLFTNVIMSSSILAYSFSVFHICKILPQIMNRLVEIQE